MNLAPFIHRSFWTAVCCAGLVLAASDLRGENRTSLDAAFSAQLTALAAKCDELNLPAEAEATRNWFIRRSPGRQYLFLPDSSEARAAEIKSGTAKLSQPWRERFQTIRDKQAAGLFELAQQAITEHQATLAFQLLHEVLHEDPAHAEARRVLGFTKNARGQWQQFAGMPAATPGAVDHPKLGWRRKSYWRQETPHYSVLTNHSPKAAVELGRQLEDIHALWQQMFFGYWSNEEALAARLNGGNEPLARERPKMKVVLFRSREEYISQLSPGEPKIPLTLGMYRDEQQTVFFYSGDASIYPTWQHEAAHQLFQESLPSLVSPGHEQNFWLIEGVAMYLESLARHEGYWTVGGWDADRLQFARYRALAGDYAPPLHDFSTLSREVVQQSPDIRKIYAHSAGLTHFLLDGEDGRYREAAVAYLTALYQGRDALDTLAKVTGVETATLDQQYLRWLNVTDADLANLVAPEQLRNLSLGRTSVTDEGLKWLSACPNLVWLDLSLTSVSDADLTHLRGMPKLQQLFLEGTKISDASLAVIGQLRELEELDLSRVAITDEGLAALAGLKQLKTLYLTNSPITDAGLLHLRGLKQLETLEITGTQITPPALKQLRTSLPKLRLKP